MQPRALSRRRLLQVGSAGAATLALTPLRAQAWPTKSVRLVVPFAPGGSSEIIARAAAAEMGKLLGQSVFVDNKPGGAGSVAMQEVARAEDQHTVILGHIGTLAVNPYIFDKLPYDADRDFKPVSLLAKVPSLYLVHPDLPAKTLPEFVALAKKQPGRLNYGSAGNGSAGHLAMESLKKESGTFIIHVPYRGTGPMLTDLLAGRLEAASVGAAAVLQFVRSGKLRCIATGTPQRIAQLPDVPTVAEQGYKGFEMSQWYGLNVPASMPAAAIERLAQAAAKAMKEPATLERLAHDAAIAVGGTPREYAAFIAAEQKRWQPVIARAKIKPD
jgi:tripartite-type tricarboxylate transporter receptor subunit TctC